MAEEKDSTEKEKPDTGASPNKNAGAEEEEKKDGKKPETGEKKAPAVEAESRDRKTDASEREAPRQQRRGPSSGIVHIKATFNNTMVTITDMSGGVISWSSAGRAGFRGSRKSTAFAATLVSQDAARRAVARGMREVEVRIQGAGSGRESAIRALQSVGMNVTVIKDVTPIPHNGCRPRKRRRV
ncbi:MAG: 30S ribosomal protein S11 [Kiritimatiellia bacterium]